MQNRRIAGSAPRFPRIGLFCREFGLTLRSSDTALAPIAVYGRVAYGLQALLPPRATPLVRRRETAADLPRVTQKLRALAFTEGVAVRLSSRQRAAR